MFLGSSCCNIAENSTFARPLDFACRLNPSFHAFAEACATETLGAYLDPETCPNRCYGIELAQRGFATCSLDLFGFGEWEVRGRKSAELQKEFYRDFPNWSLDGVQVRLHRMAIDWLTTLPDYCFGTFGAIGNSLGGRVSVYLAAFEERLTAAVVSCGISPNLTNVYRNYPGGAQPELSPRLNAAMVSCGKPP